MKTILRTLLLPAAFVVAAAGMSYYVGWAQGKKSSEAEWQALVSASTPARRMASASQRANVATKTFISVDDAQAQITNILAGNLPAGAKSAQDEIVNILEHVNPVNAAALAANLPAGPLRDEVLRRFMLSWSHDDPRTALEWVSTTALDAQEAQSLLKVILMNAPPVVGAQFLEKLTDTDIRNQVIRSIALRQAETDPLGAFAWLNQTTTGDTLTKTLADIFGMLASRPTEVGLTTDGNIINTSIEGKSGPATAVALLEKVTDPALRSMAIGEIAAGWAQSDPQAAMNWATSLPDSDSPGRAAALNTILGTWAANDPASAVAYVQKSGDPSLFLQSAPAIADALSKYNTQGALNFVQSLPDGAAKNQSLSNILVNIAPADFPAAWNFATSLPRGTSRDAAMVSLIAVQASHDPSQATGMIYELPNMIAEQNATHALAKAWFAQDPQAATEWMQTLPPDNWGIRNAAVGELINVQATKDPATTLQWANLITTDTTRTSSIQNVITTWAKTDPAAALDALQSANLTNQERNRIARTINVTQAQGK